MATAIITGSARGIGAAIALRLAKDGYDIALNDIAESCFENNDIMDKIKAQGVKCEKYIADVSKYDQCEAFVKSVKADFGSVDVLVNNAGITRDGLLVRMSEENYDIVVAVNQKSVFNMTKFAGSVMMKQRSGRIINLASVAGLYGNPGQMNYSATKAAIIGMTKTTAKELGIGSAVTVSGTIDSYAGHFDTTDKIKLGVDALGWTGIGQGNTRIAPITMLRIVSAVANGGNAVSFNIVDSLANQAGKALDFTLPSNQLSMMNSDVAAKLKEMMRYNVTNHYGESRYKGLNLCAKSGTAQIDSNENHNIAWFVGFMDDSEHPYAFVVVIENGNSGSQTAGPVAKRVLTKLVETD